MPAVAIYDAALLSMILGIVLAQIVLSDRVPALVKAIRFDCERPVIVPTFDLDVFQPGSFICPACGEVSLIDHLCPKGIMLFAFRILVHHDFIGVTAQFHAAFGSRRESRAFERFCMRRLPTVV